MNGRELDRLELGERVAGAFADRGIVDEVDWGRECAYPGEVIPASAELVALGEALRRSVNRRAR